MNGDDITEIAIFYIEEAIQRAGPTLARKVIKVKIGKAKIRPVWREPVPAYQDKQNANADEKVDETTQTIVAIGMITRGK